MGRAIAEHFVLAGANVVICARDGKALADTCDELKKRTSAGQKALAKTCDVSSEKQVQELIAYALAELGFQVFPSQANFIMVRPPRFPATTWLQKLRDRKILVRWFDDPVLRGYLRISIGTPEDVAALVKAAETILR